LKNIVSRIKSLETRVDDLDLYHEMAAAGEAGAEEEMNREYARLGEEIATQETATLLSGEYDAHGAIISVHAGAGGTDSQDWAEMLLRMYMRWIERKGFDKRLVDDSPGEEAGIKSATVIVDGEYAYGLLRAERGVHRLVRQSPFDSAHRRHTSFAQVEVMPQIDENVKVEIKDDDLKIDTYRASGAGGQHVNKTSSAVRITHLPTGIIVQCQNERSQYSNKTTAMKILKSKILERQLEEQEQKLARLRGEHLDIAWGSQIRSYVLHPYSLVKDHRTGAETGNVQAVLDGEIGIFIQAYLENRVATESAVSSEIV
jgi:peptide chain release factor 2